MPGESFDPGLPLPLSVCCTSVSKRNLPSVVLVDPHVSNAPEHPFLESALDPPENDPLINSRALHAPAQRILRHDD